MSIYVVPSLVAVLVLLWLNYYVLSHRPVSPMWPSLPLAFAVPLLFATGDLLTFAFREPEFAWASIALLYSGILFVPATWWLLAVRFAEAQGQPFRWGRKKWVMAPFVPAVLIWFGMISNPWHGQFITLMIGSQNEYHWMWWVHAVSGYALIGMTVVLYAYLAVKVGSPRQRIQILIMLLAATVNIIGNCLYVFAGDYVPFDPTALAFSISGILFLVGIHGAGLFSLSSITLATIIRGQPGGIAATNLEGKLLFWNPALERVLGASAADIGPDIYTWLSGRITIADERFDADKFKRLLRSDEAAAILANYREDGWLSIREVPISTYNRHTTGWCLQIEDYSSQRRDDLEKERLHKHMAKMQKLESLGVLAGGVAHDFNNLLMAISGNAELARNVSGDKDIDAMLDSILRASERASRLTEQLLAFAGRVPAKTRVLNLSELVMETSELLHSAVLPHGLELEFELDEDVWVEGDQAQLEQLIMNLTINAADACKQGGGKVVLRTSLTHMGSVALKECHHRGPMAPGRYAFLDVQDDGTGMSPETLSLIFDPFYTTKESGHGLGLAAALGIVTSHNGGLQVETELGAGSRFRILLPSSLEPDNGSDRADERGMPKSSTVLVVDDQHDVRNVTCALLEAAGIATVEADSGNSALQIFQEQGHEIDALVLDIAMPGMDGVETFHALRALNDHIPAVFVSGHLADDYPGDEPHCQYLMKPFTQAQLVDKIVKAEESLADEGS